MGSRHSVTLSPSSFHCCPAYCFPVPALALTKQFLPRFFASWSVLSAAQIVAVRSPLTVVALPELTVGKPPHQEVLLTRGPADGFDDGPRAFGSGTGMPDQASSMTFFSTAVAPIPLGQPA